MYRIYNGINGQSLVMLADGKPSVHIPFDEANTEYQRYLDWLAAGNEPEIV